MRPTAVEDGEHSETAAEDERTNTKLPSRLRRTHRGRSGVLTAWPPVFGHDVQGLQGPFTTQMWQFLHAALFEPVLPFIVTGDSGDR